MVRIKSTPVRFASHKSRYIGGLGTLPKELRRLVCEYHVPNVEDHCVLIGERLDKSDPDGFFFTGRIRTRLVFDSDVCIDDMFFPNDDSYKKYLKIGVQVLRHAGDLRQCNYWRRYEKNLVGTTECHLATLLDTVCWKRSFQGDETCRFNANDPYSEAYRTEQQVIREVSSTDCVTHFFGLALVAEKIHPDDREQEIEDAGDGDCDHGTRCREQSEIRSYDQYTYMLEYFEKYGHFPEEEEVSSYETDSEYDSEYDEDTGEKIESIRLADYDSKDKLFFRRTRNDYPCYWKRRIPNAHLKTPSGVTLFSPLSWRISIKPKWRCSDDPSFGQFREEESFVNGRRRYHFSEVVEIDDKFWVPWDYKNDSFIPDYIPIQYYHMGIVTSVDPQPSFNELRIIEYNVVIPLMIQLSRTRKTLHMAQFTLDRGLKTRARRIYDMDYEDTLIENAEDILYI